MDHGGNSKYFGFYVPASPLTYAVCQVLSDEFKPLTDRLSHDTSVTSRSLGDTDSTKSSGLVFSGRIYIYHEDDLSTVQLADLIKLYKQKGLDVQFRGPQYVVTRALIAHQ